MTSLDTWISDNIPDVVMDDAAAWLARLDSRHCNEADRLAFARWLAEDPTHRWAFEELSEIWARLRTLNDVGEQAARGNVLPFPVDGGYKIAPSAPSSSPPSRRRRDWSTLAASLILAAATLLHVISVPSAEKWSTGTAQTRYVVLDDGSRLHLNARTEVLVRFDDKRRELELIRGEAIFDVAADRRPFIVRTPHGTIAALGTTFSVDSRDELDEVAVLEGVVAVSATQVAAPLTGFEQAAGATLSVSSARLAAGEGAEIDTQAVRAEVLANSEIEQRLSWREGSAWFEQQPLPSVLEDMRRYTDLHIHIGHPRLREQLISGRFSIRDIDDFLNQLSDIHGIFVDRGDQGWIVLRPLSDQPEE